MKVCLRNGVTQIAKSTTMLLITVVLRHWIPNASHIYFSTMISLLLFTSSTSYFNCSTFALTQNRWHLLFAVKLATASSAGDFDVLQAPKPLGLDVNCVERINLEPEALGSFGWHPRRQMPARQLILAPGVQGALPRRRAAWGA